MDKEDIDRRAAEFAAALVGPLGPMPLERVLRQHVGLFTDLRQAGANWRQIAALMVRHGVRRKDCQPVDATQWAAMVSRALRIAPPENSGLHPVERTLLASTKAPLQPTTSPKPNRTRDGDAIRSRMRAAHAVRES